MDSENDAPVIMPVQPAAAKLNKANAKHDAKTAAHDKKVAEETAAKEAAAKAVKVAAYEKRIRARVTCDKAAYEMQWRLLDGEVEERVIAVVVELLQPQHYDDIQTERALDNCCGYIRCANTLPRGGRARYQISLAQRKVYDVEGLHRFCGVECARASHDFAASLSPTSLFLRGGAEAVHIHIYI